MEIGEGQLNQEALEVAAQLVVEGNPPEFFAIPGPFILSVSGGPDSMLLLYVFRHLRERETIENDPVVFHLHHGLRDAADEDLEFVIEASRRLGLACYYEHRDVGGFARRMGQGVEAAGRLLRYRLLARIQRDLPGAIALTGHNADDYAESVIMHLIRGGGPAAMKTMPLFTRLEGAAVARPMLCLEANRIRSLVQAAGIPFRTDESNESTEFLRNRLRKRVLPELYKEGLDPKRMRRNFHDDELGLAAGSLPEPLQRRWDYVRVDRTLWNESTRGEVKALLDIAMRRLGFSPASEVVVDNVLRASRNSRIRFETGDFMLWSGEDGPLWLLDKKGSVFRPFEAQPLALDSGERWVRLRYCGRHRDYRLGPDEETLVWSPGMRVQLEDGGRKKLKKVLQELRLPPPVRRNLPLIGAPNGPISRICLSLWNGEDRVFRGAEPPGESASESAEQSPYES